LPRKDPASFCISKTAEGADWTSFLKATVYKTSSFAVFSNRCEAAPGNPGLQTQYSRLREGGDVATKSESICAASN
jgi:hypothetical protein